MKLLNRLAIVAILALTVGCSSAQQQQAVATQDQINAAFANALHNLGAKACDPATLQQALANIPTMVLTSNQLSLAVNFGCSTLFGTTAAPATAPGNNPAFPSVAPVPASSAPNGVPASMKAGGNG